MITRGNALDNRHLYIILLKMYWTALSNTSANVLKIVTNKNGAYGSPW